MDSVTQLQNYLSSITTYMTQSLQHATYGALTVSTEQLTEALKAEHQQLAELQAQAAAKGKEAANANANGVTTAAAAATTDDSGATGQALATDASSVVAPELDAPLFSGLHPSVEFPMCDRAQALFKRVIEADVLIGSLPADVGPDAQRRQMEQLAFLESYNEKAGQELAEAEERARLWQQRVAYVLQQAAAGQIRTRHQQTEANATNNSSDDKKD